MTEHGEDRSLDATGERLVPELQHGQVVHAEHLARYQLAAQLAGSRRVLDAACGDGYGTHLMALAGVEDAVGIDLDERTVDHARRRYGAARFVQADVREMPFENGEFDLIVSFETIEHVKDPDRALDELLRVLADEGVLVISTPNKDRYLVDNEFHEREFSHEEFVELLSSRFATVELMLQHNWLASAVLNAEAAAESSGTEIPATRFSKVGAIAPGEELYTIALCGSGRMPAVAPVVVAAGLDESQELAQRVVSAERSAKQWHEEYLTARGVAEEWHAEFAGAKATAEDWHDQFERSEGRLLAVYQSVWWRMTAPLRLVADRVRHRGG